MPSPDDGWTLRLDPYPELAEGDRIFIDWEDMTYVVTQDVPPVADDRIRHWQELRRDGALSPREDRMLHEIERLRGLPWGSEGGESRPDIP